MHACIHPHLSPLTQTPTWIPTPPPPRPPPQPPPCTAPWEISGWSLLELFWSLFSQFKQSARASFL